MNKVHKEIQTMAKEQVVEEVKEEGLTLEKFEEASEEVKKVT